LIEAMRSGGAMIDFLFVRTPDIARVVNTLQVKVARCYILHAMNTGTVASVSESGELYIGGARYLPARDIAAMHGYVRDYVARLCRQGKVDGRRLGRLWYVDTDSFAAFVSHNDNHTGPGASHPAV
jgi:hypothetical protein